MPLHRAVVVAQLVERSLLIPEIRGSNPAIGKFYLLSTDKKLCHYNRPECHNFLLPITWATRLLLFGTYT